MKKTTSASTSAKYPSETTKKGDRIAEHFEVNDIRKGGMGRVYFCYDHSHNEPVAIKTFKGASKRSVGKSRVNLRMDRQ